MKKILNIKILNLIFIAIFVAVCAVPMMGMVFGYKNISAEKRALPKMPSISSQGGINTKFTQEFDNYFTDNFAFRPAFITADAFIHSRLFGESVSQKVIVGKEGWLFFQPTQDNYTGANLLSDNEIYRICKTLEIQQMYLNQQGIDFVFTVAPNKSSIYGQFMPDRYVVMSEQSNADKLYAELNKRGINHVNLHEVLENPKDQIYHKLDSHWNNKGALAAYNALLSKIADNNNEFDFNKYQGVEPDLEMSWNGDLSGMLYPAANIKDWQYDYGIQIDYTSARPIKSLEELTIKTKCENADFNLYMLRDSFANALIPMMSNEFATAVYSRATPYDYGILKQDNIDMVMLEIAERNLPDLIKKAPIMPAPMVELSDGLIPSEMDIAITSEEIGGFVKIAGFAVPEQYSSEKDYDIFVRISDSEESNVYVPFPIFEESYFEGNEDNGNVSFSMLLEKSMMPAEFTADIILFDGTRYFVCAASGD